MKKLLFVWLLAPAMLCAQGMWVPLLLEKQNEKEMRAMGLKIKADDIFHNQKPSLKDAICQFSGGCTGEIISAQGLLLTNHHCGFGAIQRLSTLDNNYVEDGYWAAAMSDELPCPGATAMFVNRMDDVTALALRGVQDNMSESDRQAQIDKNLADIRRNTKIEKHEEIQIRPFYNGNQYYLFVTTTYKDVRLVGTPPSSIGKFGADTDNWVWPRHTGDFALFRVYAGPDNLPAEYSPANRPFTPKRFLSISIAGVKEGDFTMVYGFPGRTDAYLPAAAVAQIAGTINPARVAIRDQSLKAMDRLMRADPAVKIAYIARYASIANAWKKWLGEMEGLRTYRAFDYKKEYEATFTQRVNANPDWKFRYGNLLPRLNQLYAEFEPYNLAREVYAETCLRNCEALSLAASMDSWLKTFTHNGPVFFNGKMPEVKKQIEGALKNYRADVDQAVFATVIENYLRYTPNAWGGARVRERLAAYGDSPAKMAEALYARSLFTDRSRLLQTLEGEPAACHAALSQDPLYTLWSEMYEAYATQVQPKIQELQPLINLLQRQYMEAQLRVFKERRFFPDANGTLRLTYGQVRGYEPRDAVRYHYLTTLDGVAQKYVPGDYEFDVPAKLLDLYARKDYGRYADASGKLPIAFVATNRTTGGNSGSPALDARGNLIGLNFDRVWEGTMSDLYFDPAICRNIMVDARYILFVIDKYANAQRILNELRIVK